MASAAWSTETDEKINYTKLCRLLVDGGTQAVRSVFDGIHPPSSLKAALTANRAKLQRLRRPRGRVLNNEQWDQLYPPSGSDPESEDFDITLLFVLLRNICGLTAPAATGWDALPPVTDPSKEANLARIKYYRNNAIAHKSSAEICDADFKQLWQDISSALVSLGLSQYDIDDLKSAPLGKKNYNQLLDDWYVSDKDIKTQLEEVKSDTADLKSDTADLKSDTAGIKSDTAGIKSDTAGIKSDTAGIKSDTAGIKSDTADLKSDTADLKSDTAGLKSDTAGIKSDTAGIKSDTVDIREKLHDIRNVCMGAHKMADHILKLAFSDFTPEINAKCKLFHPNTRQRFLDQVESHVRQNEPRVMLITAGPGMGKSTLAAKICQAYKALGCLAGCHFFQSRNSTRNNPRLMLQSIAKQMCDTVPGYRKALERKLQTNLGKEISQMNCEELLTVLFEESLCNVEQPTCNLVVVLDALDECSMEPNDDLLKALRTKLPHFPPWLRLVFTSRPSRNTSGAFWSTVGVEIEPNDQANIKDLELFFSFELKACYPQYGDNVNLGKELVKMTKGLFLVAPFMMEYLKRENVASPEKILEMFPNGISSVYENYFSRLKEVLLPYISEEERFYKMLEAVVATNNSLPKDVFYNILCLKSEREVSRQERKTRNDALNTLHWLFPIAENHVTAFHKSVTDWLTLQGDEEHDFSVRVEDGDEVLASQCNDVLSNLRNGEKDLDKPLSLTDNEEYAVRFLAFLSKKGSSVVRLADRMFSNIYVLTALSIETNFQEDRNEIIPSSLLEILRGVKFWSDNTSHCRYCHLFRPLPFGCYLALVLQAVRAKGVNAELTPRPLDVLKEHLLPYFDKTILERSSYSGCLLKRCKDGFIAVFRIPCSMSTAIYRFQLDGCLITKRECFPYETLVATSPNTNFIVAAQNVGKEIKILHRTTLEVVSEYKFPRDAIDTCHVFGEDQNFFIVIKGCHKNKVYVIEGLTGRVRNTITVTGSTVMDVSCLGHIVVSRKWRDKNNEDTRELFLYCHNRHEHVPILAPRLDSGCLCFLFDFWTLVEAVNISEDGRLVAFHFRDSISVVNTSDGSLFKQWPLQRWSRNPVILFVSEAYLVISFEKMMLVINIQTDEIEHRFYLPYKVDFTYKNQYLLLPEQDGKSFSLISSLCDFDSKRSPKVSRLVFHNLNLRQSLQ